jgi:hypothetical protein
MPARNNGWGSIPQPLFWGEGFAFFGHRTRKLHRAGMGPRPYRIPTPTLYNIYAREGVEAHTDFFSAKNLGEIKLS